MRRLQLGKEAAQELRILASARLGGHGAGECERMAEALIRAAWLEYDKAIQRQVEQAIEKGIPL